MADARLSDRTGQHRGHCIGIFLEAMDHGEKIDAAITELVYQPPGLGALILPETQAEHLLAAPGLRDSKLRKRLARCGSRAAGAQADLRVLLTPRRSQCTSCRVGR